MIRSKIFAMISKLKKNTRNKCIKIADKFPVGWGTLKQYISDYLASDTDDDRRIRSAESRAVEAKKNLQQDRNKRKFGNSHGSKMSEVSHTVSSGTVTTSTDHSFRANEKNNTEP